ncbi:MAG: GNAT family N-acetyltransferase [Patescibacteria group bacterium]
MFSIRVVSKLDEARNVWNLLSPKSGLYEDWDFCFVFYKYFQYPLRFYVGEEDGKAVGLLALQYHSEKGCLEFFGGNFMEDNHVFIKPGFEKYIPKFYEAIREKARLEDIVRDNEYVPMEFLENKYVINLKNISGIEDYLQKTFSSNSRRRFRKIKKTMEELPLFRIMENRLEDVDALMEMNQRNFEAESSFNKPFRSQIYHDLVRQKELDIVMFTAEIAGKVEGVSLGIKYQKVFNSFNAGVNKRDFSNLGSYLRLCRIEKAIALGCDTFDAGLEDLGWKELWHLEKVPEYKFTVG